MEPRKSKISVRNVSRTFPAADGKCVNALENINFEIEDAFSSFLLFIEARHLHLIHRTARRSGRHGVLAVRDLLHHLTVRKVLE